MRPSSEVAKSLQYLRKRYKVSERDLVALARRLQVAEEPEQSWEDLTRDYIRKRKQRLGSKT